MEGLAPERQEAFYSDQSADTRHAVLVLIVGYRNAKDVVACLRALSEARKEPPFEIFICENGGPEAFDALKTALIAEAGPCTAMRAESSLKAPLLKRQCTVEFKPSGSGRRVYLGEASENLGYAGGINAWLRALMDVPGWPAVWILNPDTEPAPDALHELAAYSRRRGKGMVGSRGLPSVQSTFTNNRGLAWRKLRAATVGVDLGAAADVEPDSSEVESRLDAPSGASMYVTRACIEGIGLMNEGYFLYFEDLEWGLRAKQTFGVGYAHRSVVYHAGGTTIGGAGRRADHSPLSVYLNFRNRILFVRRNFPRWLPWTVFMQVLDAVRCHALPWQPLNLMAAFRGIAAGIAGRSGRPDHMLRRHR